MEILVKYFDNQSQAKKFYNNENITHYVLASSDRSKSSVSTKEWFESTKWPLVSQDRKLCGVLCKDSSFSADDLLDGWLAEEDLSVRYTSKALENQAFGDKKDDSYISSNSTAQIYIDELSETYTDDQNQYLSAIFVYGLGLCESLECRELSIKSNDAYSKSFWSIQADQYLESLKNIYLPVTEQQDPSLNDIDGTLTYYVGKISSYFNEAKQNEKPNSDLSEIISSFKLWITTEIK